MTPSLNRIANPYGPLRLIRHIGLITTLLIGLLSVSPSWANETAEAVNINTASAEIIAETLSGIGLKKAQAIVEWRESHGKFTHKEQLTAIKGIGEATLAKNNERIRLK